MSGARWGARGNRPRSPERWQDPIPPRGIGERVYCTIRARFGYWPETFVSHVQRSYRGQIPPRLQALAAKLEREKPWLRDIEIEERGIDSTTGLPPMITIVSRDGTEQRFRPTKEEWAEPSC